jgi:release factor glutamine methyltransferase
LLISEALEQASDRLSSAGVLSPSVDAEILCGHAMNVSRSELTSLLVLDQVLTSSQLENFLFMVARREKREPLQHITGLAPFRHLELEVGPGVFVPRPETEQVVSIAIEKIQGIQNPVVVDLCSGSGAITISLSTEIQGAKVYGVELSKEAFAFLQRNFLKYGLDQKLLRNQDLGEAFDELESMVDLVISNPPYIPDQAVPIDLEVQLYDPKLALYGGDDGLDVIRQISARAQYLLKPGGALLLEHADTQAPSVGELLLAEGWQGVSSFKDLAGKDRMTFAQLP